MFRNYFKVAIRNLLKQRAYSIINIAGLGVGIACFILIFLYVQDELSYDRYHSKADRIYRVVTKMDINGVGERAASCSFPVGPTLQKEFPEAIQSMTRFFNYQSPRHLISAGGVRDYEKNFFITDSSVFDVFDIPLIYGDKKTALDSARKVIISEQIAKKYFGNVNPMGKIIMFAGRNPLKVSGVFRNVPLQSHFQFDFLTSFSTMGKYYHKVMTTWVWNPCWTYILLKDGYGPDYINSRLPSFVKRHFDPKMAGTIISWLQPLTSIHLHSDMDYEIRPNGSITYIYIISAIGIFILLIASINFMNLSTARSANRAREIGMRKTLGALRSQLIFQFICESILMAFISLLLALAMVELAMPAFNDFTGKHLSVLQMICGTPLLFLLGFGLLLGMLSGLYPAFYLSSFRPIAVLRGIFKPGIKSGRLRQALVILQFALSITLITCTIVVYCQLSFVRHKDLGFNPKNIILLPVQNTPVVWKYDTLKYELLKYPYIKNVTAIEDILGAFHNTHEFKPEGYLPDQWYFFPALIVHDDFLETFEIPVVAGRGYCKDSVKDKWNGIIINESMVRYMGWTSNEEALGRKFSSFTGNERIIGVVRDFNTNSLYYDVSPFVLNMKEDSNEIVDFIRYIAVRTEPGHEQEAVEFMKKKWDSMHIDYPFQWSYLTDELDKLYVNDKKLAALAIVFSLLAIFIAALGLFGLVSYMIESRTREIGIRKVLGSSTPHMIYVLIRSFFIMIAVSGVLAIFPSVLIMNIWLSHFAFRSNLPWWSFLLAILIAMATAFVTIIIKALRAARSNVVDALKNNI